MAGIFTVLRYSAGVLYSLVTSLLVLVLVGYGWALCTGQAGLDLRVVPVAAAAGFSTWFACWVLPRR